MSINRGCWAATQPSVGRSRLAYAQRFDLITDAIAAERQIKGWSRVKKEALIAADFAGLRAAAKRKGSFSKPFAAALSSFETRAAPAPQDEDE